MNRFAFNFAARFLIATQFFLAAAQVASILPKNLTQKKIANINVTGSKPPMEPPAPLLSAPVFYAEIYKRTPVPKEIFREECTSKNDNPDETDIPQFIETKTILSSPGFKPDEADTAASHIKLLSALVVLKYMELNPGFREEINPVYGRSYWELLRGTLISSYGGFAQELLRRISDGTDDGVRKLLENEARTLGLSSKFHARNAAGDPDYPIPNGHADSKATARDRMKILHALGEHREKLVEIYSSAGTFRIDSPTLNLFYPIAQLGDVWNGAEWAACKSASDMHQTLSAACHEEIDTGQAIIVIDFYQRNPASYAQSIPSAAQSMLNVMNKAGIDTSEIRRRYRDIASGRMTIHDVGAPPGFLYLRQTLFVPILPVPEAGKPVNFLSVFAANAHASPSKSHAQMARASGSAKGPVQAPARPRISNIVATANVPQAAVPRK